MGYKYNKNVKLQVYTQFIWLLRT